MIPGRSPSWGVNLAIVISQLLVVVAMLLLVASE